MYKKNLSVIIPCFNEGPNLIQLYENIKNTLITVDFEIEVILVNNGSSDNSSKILENFQDKDSRIKILNIKKNIGYGHGILKGLEYSKYDFLCWTHADMQCDFNDCILGFYRLFEKINLDNKKIILKGNRIKRKFLDLLFTKLMTLFINIFCKVNINDINAQPKIFPRELYKKFKNPPYDFLLDFYFLNLSQSENYKIINIDVNFKDRKFGIAKGGGSIFGKIRLSIKTAYYIIKYTYGNNNT